MTSKTRPSDRTTMRGMIYNANQVLDRALSDNKNNAIPKEFFQKARGIAIISSIEAGFVFSGNVGTGIVMAKDETGKWSPPSAVGLSGIGWGLLIGASLKDIVLFLFDDLTVDTLAGEVGIKFGVQGEVAVGPFGRTADVSVNLSNGGIGSTFALAHTKGLFAGLSLDGAILGCRENVNTRFYNKFASPKQILFENVVDMPADTWMPEVYCKLNLLSKQNSATKPTPDLDKKLHGEPVLVDSSEPELQDEGSEDDAAVKECHNTCRTGSVKTEGKQEKARESSIYIL